MAVIDLDGDRGSHAGDPAGIGENCGAAGIMHALRLTILAEGVPLCAFLASDGVTA